MESIFYDGHPSDAIAGKEGESLRRDDLAADHDGDSGRTGDRRCGADAAHGLSSGHHLLWGEDGLPDGGGAGLRLKRLGQSRKGGGVAVRGGRSGRCFGTESVERFLETGEVLGGTLRGGHQHQIAGVGILALHALLPQSLRQLLAREAQHGGIQRQLERLTARPGEGEGQPGPEGIQLPAEHPQTPAAEGQLLPEVACQPRIGGVQRL